MPTNPTAGQKCIVQINNTTYQTQTGLKTAEISISTDIYDITDLNSNTWKIKLAGLNDYSMKLGGNFDLSDAQQAFLQASVFTSPGSVIQWKVWPAGTLATHNYSGSGIIKSQSVKFDVKSEEQVSWDIEGSGPVVYV